MQRLSLLTGTLITLLLLTLATTLLTTLFDFQTIEDFTTIEPRVWSLLRFTLYQAFLSTLLSIIVGGILAWSLAHQSRFFGRSFLVALFSSSLVLPTLVVVFGLITLLGRNGWVNQALIALFDLSFGSYLYGLVGILVAHVYLNASFTSRSLLHAFESIPVEKYKLAKSLGFGVWRRFWWVEFPVLKPTLLSVASTIFLLCFTSFAIVLVLGGSPAYNTLEVAIYEAVKLDFDIPMALKLALIQLSISAILVIFSAGFKSDGANLKTSSYTVSWREKPLVRYFQYMIIALFGLFFTLPLVAIVVDGMGADFAKIFGEELFQTSLKTSLLLATLSASMVVILALFLSDLRRSFLLDTRLKGRKFAKLFNGMVAFAGNLYLAIPSLILGLGFFLLAQRYEMISMEAWTWIALITANVLMALPFALSVLTPAMLKIAQRYDRLVFSLGLSGWERWRYVELPYLRSSLGYIFALAFCFSLGDLGVIALFGSEELSTLPWYLYELMGSYRTSDASGVALVLLGITLSAFILLPKLLGERRVNHQ